MSTELFNAETAGQSEVAGNREAKPPGRSRRRVVISVIQAAIIAAFLLAWQYLPSVHWLSSRYRFLDPYFVSSPSQVFSLLVDIMSGRNGSFTIWSYLWPTAVASLLSIAIGMVLGGIVGLILSNSKFLMAVLRPFLVLVNAVPRIAVIPIAIIIFGLTLNSSVIVSVFVVFFVVFWNAFEGGQAIAEPLIQNAILLGASRFQVIIAIRAPYVLAWTLASLPNAATFGILTVVTTEVLTGYHGLGFLISQSISTADATLTFTVAVVLAVLSLLVVGATELVKRRILHWWNPARG
jgi:NitT/TauT family transport system permease protein